MTEQIEVDDLASRFNEACNTVFTTAIANQDVNSAVAVAKSALSVAVQLGIDLNQPSYPELAISWFERLSSLYSDSMPPPNDIAKTLEWAGSAIAKMLQSLQDQTSKTGPAVQ
jgi:hypothetical protein